MATTGQSHGRQRKACGTKWNRTKVKIIGKNCEFRFFFFFSFEEEKWEGIRSSVKFRFNLIRSKSNRYSYYFKSDILTFFIFGYFESIL